jgi:hypothetical protein
MEIRPTCIASIFFISIFGMPAQSFAQKNSTRKIEPAQETIVAKIGVAKIGSGSKKKPSLDLVEIQEAIVKVLTERSYVDAVLVDKVASTSENNSKLVQLAQEKSVDAILAGEYGSQVMRMSLRSGLTGRSLVRWTFPVPQKKDKNKEAELLKSIVDTIVRDFPYRVRIGATSCSLRATTCR